MTEIDLTILDLPPDDRVGQILDWELPTGENDVLRFTGKFLGTASSQRPHHNPESHRAGEYAPTNGQKCGACRWFEPRLFREVLQRPPKRFLIHYAGVSIVPGETLRVWHQWVNGPHEVVEALTTRRMDAVYLTKPAARVLAQAAAQDDDLLDAYVNRAVS